MTGLPLIFGRLKTWLAVAGVFAAALAVAFFRGRSAGRAIENAKQGREREQARKISREIEDDVSKADPDELRRRASRWLRGE